MNQILESQQTPHISPSRVSYGVSIVGMLEKIDRVITAPHCIWIPRAKSRSKQVKCDVIYQFSQFLGLQLYLLSVKNNIRLKFITTRSVTEKVTPVILSLWVVCVWSIWELIDKSGAFISVNGTAATKWKLCERVIWSCRLSEDMFYLMLFVFSVIKWEDEIRKKNPVYVYGPSGPGMYLNEVSSFKLSELVVSI